MATDPSYLDVALPADAAARIPLPAGHTACVYVFEGVLHDGNPGHRLNTHSAGVLSDGDSVLLSAHSAGCRALVLAGRPLNEPVVQYGPFVMNTRDQIEHAMHDYRDGRLTTG